MRNRGLLLLLVAVMGASWWWGVEVGSFATWVVARWEVRALEPAEADAGSPDLGYVCEYCARLERERKFDRDTAGSLNIGTATNGAITIGRAKHYDVLTTVAGATGGSK